MEEKKQKNCSCLLKQKNEVILKTYQNLKNLDESGGTDIVFRFNKAISMMRGKSPPSEHILEIIKSNSSLIKKKKMKRDIISFLSECYQ